MLSSAVGRYRSRFAAEIALAVLASLVAFILVAVVSEAARSHVPDVAFGAALLIPVFVVARLAGILYALPIGVVTILAFDWYFLLPLRLLDWATVFVLVLFLSVSVMVGAFATYSSRRAIASEAARGTLADEQAALRRVATLVAHESSPPEVFEAVAEEVGKLLRLDDAYACVVRYEADATATIVATSAEGAPWPTGSNWPLEGESIIARIFRTRSPARMDGYEGAPGELAMLARRARTRSGAGAPIKIGERVWGAAVVTSEAADLPATAEQRIANFADLIATAITNAETRAELNASRARVVAASDETRRRLERDLHDGLQQRLVTLALQARTASVGTAEAPEEVRSELSRLSDGIVAALDELRETARGIHPAILTEAGLGPALKALARRCAIPVRLDVNLDRRLEGSVEVGAYYVASEALTNAVKHADASVIDLILDYENGTARLSVRDDGVGGVDPAGGFGLLGLKDRVEALAGELTIVSPPGHGTTVVARLPTTAMS